MSMLLLKKVTISFLFVHREHLNISRYLWYYNSCCWCVLKDDVKLWLQHIKYCQRMNQHGLTSQVFGKALAIHPSHIG